MKINGDDPRFLGTGRPRGGQNNGLAGYNPGHLSDEDLLARCRSGDLAACGPLVERYQHRLYNAVLRMVANVDDAQDIAQEAFFRALRSVKKFRGSSGFYTWLFRIAMNLCINHRQQRQRLHVSSLSEHDDLLGGQASRLAELADHRGIAPARRVEISEEHQRVLAALEKLEPQARAVVVLRDIEELDYDRIARVLEIPVGTVKSRLFRARLALREQLSPPETRPTNHKH